jgi:hypothetical protein
MAVRSLRSGVTNGLSSQRVETLMTKTEQMRLVRLRSKLPQMAESSSRGVTRACRHFGISRQAFYSLPPPELPLWAAQDCGLSEAVSRHFRRWCDCAPDLGQERHEQATGEPEVSAAREALETLREGAARPPPPDGREIPQAHPGTKKRLYQFTAIDDCTRIRVLKIYDCYAEHDHPFCRRSDQTTAFQNSRHSDRQRRRVSVEVSLASGPARHPSRLHPATDASPQRQGRALAPRRQPGVLPAATTISFENGRTTTTTTVLIALCLDKRLTSGY